MLSFTEWLICTITAVLLLSIVKTVIRLIHEKRRKRFTVVKKENGVIEILSSDRLI